MSAGTPVTVGEKAAKDWAESLDITPAGIVARIADLRADQEEASKVATDAHGAWRAAADRSDQIRDRIEALKHRLAVEL